MEAAGKYVKEDSSKPDACIVSNCDTWFLKQFEAKRIEAIEIGKIQQGSSCVLVTI